MANNPNQRDEGAQARVYRQASVHKRRAGTPGHAGRGRRKVEARDADQDSAEGRGGLDAGPGRLDASDADVQWDDAEPGVGADGQGALDDPEDLDGSEKLDGSENLDDAEDFADGEDFEDEYLSAPRRGSIVRGALAVLVALVLVFVGYYVAQRWFLHDDAESIQGVWNAAGTSVPVTIEDGVIRLNDQTAYAYEIDPTAKTISYTFSNLEGQGHYWFSADRNVLVITDGEGFTMWSTLLDDIAHDARNLFDDLFSGGAQTPSGDNVIALTRAGEA